MPKILLVTQSATTARLIHIPTRKLPLLLACVFYAAPHRSLWQAHASAPPVQTPNTNLAMVAQRARHVLCGTFVRVVRRRSVTSTHKLCPKTALTRAHHATAGAILVILTAPSKNATETRSSTTTTAMLAHLASTARSSTAHSARPAVQGYFPRFKRRLRRRTVRYVLLTPFH